MSPITLVLLLLGIALGGGVGYVYRTRQLKEEGQKKHREHEKALEEAAAKSNEILLKAKSESLKIQEEAKKEERIKKKKLEEMEERVISKEKSLDQRIENSEKIKEQLEKETEILKKKKEEADKALSAQEAKLQEIAALNKDQAKELLFKKIEEEFKGDLTDYARKLEKEIKDEAEEKAKQILADTIQRYASETTVESTTTIVPLPSDELKGRIIGREGRNINAFETVTGVDVIVDDTPGSIIISSFDPIRRYIAKITLERLIEDGRIHPARIEESAAKVKEEVNILIKDLGEKAAFEVGVPGLPVNLIKILGRLKFRISYGQNVLKHSMEVAFLAAEIAGMLGAKIDICKKAGLLHDIGKAVDHEIQGKHAMIGRDILKKFGVQEDVLHCVEANEGDVAAESIEAKIIQVANLMSVSRPGVDKDNLESFIKRLGDVERVAMEFKGVEKAFAVQAGRELRVFVNPEELDDLQAIKLSHQIARQIEKELQYPGKIKVDVVRELRVEAYAE